MGNKLLYLLTRSSYPISSVLFNCLLAIYIISPESLHMTESQERQYVFSSSYSQNISLSAVYSTKTSETLTVEQLVNYHQEFKRLTRIIDLLFGNSIEEVEKKSWLLLMLGTVATETHFLFKYYGISDNGNGPYQITGSSAYDLIHNYLLYPIDGMPNLIRQRNELTILFEQATNGRCRWQDIRQMDTKSLRRLCAEDYDAAALMALLIYKRKLGSSNLPSDALDLARIWKEHYNTFDGIGTEERFVERFNTIKPYLSQADVALFCNCIDDVQPS